MAVEICTAMLKSYLKLMTMNHMWLSILICDQNTLPFSIHSPIPLDLLLSRKIATNHVRSLHFHLNILFSAALVLLQVPNHHKDSGHIARMNSCPQAMSILIPEFVNMLPYRAKGALQMQLRFKGIEIRISA